MMTRGRDTSIPGRDNCVRTSQLYQTFIAGDHRSPIRFALVGNTHNRKRSPKKHNGRPFLFITAASIVRKLISVGKLVIKPVPVKKLGKDGRAEYDDKRDDRLEDEFPIADYHAHRVDSNKKH